MRNNQILRIIPAALCVAAIASTAAAKDWPCWGGPNHDFTIKAAAPLAESWPADGPKQLWKLDVKGGYSSIPVVDGVAYVMARDGDDELLHAIDANSGEQKWEYRYAAPIPPSSGNDGYTDAFGYGPNSTPLVLDDCVVMIGHTSKMHCINKDGSLKWKHDLREEYNGTLAGFGYSASPILYKGAVIALVGGEGHALMSFNPKDGSVNWAKHDYAISYGSPRIMQLDGKDVLVTQVTNHALACDPSTGEMLWSAPREYQYRHNAASPIVCSGDMVFFGTPGKGGKSGCYKLSWDGDKINGEEMWESRFAQVHQNTLAIDGKLLSSNGRPAIVEAVSLEDGDSLWRSRDFGHSNFVMVGDKLVALTEDGTLRLCKMSGEGLEVMASAKLLGERSWGPPTIVGTKCYIRNPEAVIAVDLGASAMAAK